MAEGFDDSELERMLIDLVEHLDYPATPNLSGKVREHLQRQPHRPRRHLPSLLWTPTYRGVASNGPQWVVAGAMLVPVLLAAAVLALSPATRTAVASWLGLPGIRIIVGGPAPTAAPLGRNLDLGRRVTLAEAQRRAPFRILIPTAHGLENPDDVYIGSTPARSSRVSLLYRARPGLPRTPETRVGLLPLVQKPGSLKGASIDRRAIL